ncbi:MAG TPA: class I SAM-dependent methyltransferase [Azospirillaceae bacterium]|nr:class I SAM-dependent methyltransferase [Azospirillaceae bacterium]
MTDGDGDARIRASWEANAGRWTDAVRAGAIRSRRLATDDAVAAAVAALSPDRVLDLGCGEGWLARRLAHEAGCRVTGTDASPELIRRAAAADPGGDYRTLSYGELAQEPDRAGGPFDAVVANFALLDRELGPLLAALARLAPVLVVQTVHPWAACGDGPYRDGWREESFAGFGEPGWAPMPWYYRTLASWHAALAEAGWHASRLEEPADPETGRPLSLLLTCRRGAGPAPVRPA